MKKNKIKLKPRVWILTIVICINLYYLYLINHSEDYILGMPSQDFALVIAILYGACWWGCLYKRKNPPFRFKWWMLSTVLLAFLSSLQSNILYGQSMILGIAPQRWVLIWAFLYFPIEKAIYYDKLKFQDIIHVITFIGVLQLVLFIKQYLNPDVELLQVGTGVRNASIRYYFSPVLLDLMFMICLDNCVRKNGLQRLFYIIYASCIFFEVIVVQQFRLTSCGLIICLGLFVVFVRGKREYKFLYFILGAVALGILFNTSLVQDVLDRVLNNSYDNGTKIRGVGRLLYLETWLKHPVLAGGYPSTFYQPARLAAGMNQYIYLYDNGIFGFIYMYGMVGVIWIVTLWKILLSNGIKIQKRFSELSYLLVPVFFMVTCINEIHWYWEYGFVVFVLFLCLQESKIESIERIELDESGTY